MRNTPKLQLSLVITMLFIYLFLFTSVNTYGNNELVNIPDPNLRAAIETALGKASEAPITRADMATLDTFGASNANISDLTGLEHATNLTGLQIGSKKFGNTRLNSNSISDISALAGLTNLTWLDIDRNAISDISALAGLTNLTRLDLAINSIVDISALESLVNLEGLSLADNSIVDISALESLINAGLTKLTLLYLNGNAISDISALAGLTNLTRLDLTINSIVDISALESLVNLEELSLEDNSITDFSALVNNSGLGKGDTVLVSGNPLTNDSILSIITLKNRGIEGLPYDSDLIVHIPDPALRAAIEDTPGSVITVSDVRRGPSDFSFLGISDLTGLEFFDSRYSLDLRSNKIKDLTPLAGIKGLGNLYLGDNNITDISALTGKITIKNLSLEANNITDITPLAGLKRLEILNLEGNSITDITPLADLKRLEELNLDDNNIADLAPLVANAGLKDYDKINVSRNPLNDTSINVYIPQLQDRLVFDSRITFTDLKPPLNKPVLGEYTLSIPMGTSLIHIPLKITLVNGMEKNLESISDLYDALGGADTVNFLITYDSQTQGWRSYFSTSDTGTPADKDLTDDTGIIVGMTVPVSIRLGGDALGTNGNSAITLTPGLNLVGLPLRDSRIIRVSDLFALDGIGDNVSVIILNDGGEFQAVGQAGDPGDIEITGGQSFILTAQRAATVAISGEMWTNVSGTAAAPPLSLTGIEIGDTTPILELRGAIVDEEAGLNQGGFRATVKNLSTGRAVTAVAAPDEAGYRFTIVDIETGRAAQIGDIFEISAQSPNPFIGVEPLQYTITTEDVKRSQIQLPELIVYEIPAETELLANYPNPFNPETWIPYRLANDSDVQISIYDINCVLVRQLDLGYQRASYYTSRSRAAYWDGRNEFGEQIASGIYFYQLQADNVSLLRKMVILK